MLPSLAQDAKAKLNYPSLSERVQSTFIDTIIIVVLMFSFSAILEKYDDAPDWVRIALFAGVFLVYEPVCTSLGCTIGNYIKGIRVRRFADTTKRINIFQAVVRYVLKLILGWISFLTMHSNTEKRAIHDFAAGSVMIKT